MTAQPVSFSGMYETYAFTAHSDLITALFHSPQIKFAHLSFTASSCDVGDQDILHFIWHSHSTRLCDRVGVYALLERKWNSNNEM